MAVGLPDVPNTREWESWCDHCLINEWRANASPEQTLNSVVQGLQFLPNGNGPTGHLVSLGIAYINGYRVKYDGSQIIDFTEDGINIYFYLIYAVLKRTADVEAGYENAWIELVVQETDFALGYPAADPPAEPHILIGSVVYQPMPAGIDSGLIWWFDCAPRTPEIIDADLVQRKRSNAIEQEATQIKNKSMISISSGVWNPYFWYRCSEEMSANLIDEVNGIDTIDCIGPPYYVRPTKGRRTLGQIFDAYLGGVASYRMATAPVTIMAEPTNETWFMSIWAYPFRDDVDMYLLYKDFDFYLFFNSASQQISWRWGDGAGGWNRYVFSNLISNFKDSWHHIVFGYDHILDKLFIIINNGERVFETVTVGPRGPWPPSDFYMGRPQTPILPFYGILDEFSKWGTNETFSRMPIGELYLYGFANTYLAAQEGGVKSSAKMTINQAIASGMTNKAQFNNFAGFGDSYFFDVANNRFIISKAGDFLITAGIRIENPVADNVYIIEVRVNGSVFQKRHIHASHADLLSLTITHTKNLIKNDYVEIWVKNPATGFLITLFGGADDSLFALVEIHGGGL